MAIIGVKQKLGTFEVRGALGKPNSLGDMLLGWTELGDQNPFSGIYQIRPRAKRSIQVRMRTFGQINPKTEAQQAWRAYFATVRLIWGSMSSDLQSLYQKSQKPTAMSAWNRFARVYMRRKPTDLGNMILGMSELGDLTP